MKRENFDREKSLEILNNNRFLADQLRDESHTNTMQMQRISGLQNRARAYRELLLKVQYWDCDMCKKHCAGEDGTFVCDKNNRSCLDAINQFISKHLASDMEMVEDNPYYIKRRY